MKEIVKSIMLIMVDMNIMISETNPAYDSKCEVIDSTLKELYETLSQSNH